MPAIVSPVRERFFRVMVAASIARSGSASQLPRSIAKRTGVPRSMTPRANGSGSGCRPSLGRSLTVYRVAAAMINATTHAQTMAAGGERDPAAPEEKDENDRAHSCRECR